MSSSGQAPNVSMDDLLASIKSMIEGESNGGANTQPDVGRGLSSAEDGGAPQGGAIQGGAMDDGIMDLTNVVPPQNNVSPEKFAASGGGVTAEDAASHLNDILGGMDAGNNHAGGGDIGLPAGHEGGAPSGEEFGFDQAGMDAAFGSLNEGPAGQQQSAEEQQGGYDSFFDDLAPDDQQANGGQDGQGQQGIGQQGIAQHGSGPGGISHGQMEQAGQQPTSMIEQLQGASPLDQQAGRSAGGDAHMAGGQQPAPHSPQPPVQGGMMQGGSGAMGQQAHDAAEQGDAGEPMGGHDPRLENDIAMGQVLQQADASLRASQGLSQDPQKQAEAHAQAQAQAEAQAFQQHQQQLHDQMRGMQQPYPPQGQVPQGHIPQGQYPQGQVPQGQYPQGQIPQNQYPQGHMAQGHVAQGQLSQGQHPQGPQGQMPVAANGDMLPVPSGFRPVLPAVQQPMGLADPMAGPMADQLPVEMRNNLEEIVKQLLKPLLREWLAQNLPELLKSAVDEKTGKIDPDRW